MVEVIREPIDTPDAWVGPEIQGDPRWLHILSDAEVAEIDAALQAVKAAGTEIPFAAEDFPLPTFRARLDELMDRVSNGLGVILIRGVPRDRYTDEECGLIYWGISAHIGAPVSQNARGHLLGHARLQLGLALQQAGATKDVPHGVVPLVAGVLVEAVARLRPRVLPAVGGFEVTRLDGELVEQGLAVDAREALHHFMRPEPLLGQPRGELARGGARLLGVAGL